MVFKISTSIEGTFHIRVSALHLGNLERAEECESSKSDGLEYNLWLAADCAGTEFQNVNRTWFHFSVAIPPNFNKKVLRLVYVCVVVDVEGVCDANIVPSRAL